MVLPRKEVQRLAPSLMSSRSIHFPATLGTLLKDGQYEILRMLGSGRASITYLVQDHETK